VFPGRSLDKAFNGFGKVWLRIQVAAEREVIDAWTLFQIALSPRKAYPMKELTTLFETVVRYAAVMQDSPYLHKTVAGTFSGFREHLELERKRVPGDALALADRLEVVLFAGYDPYFEGDEPLGQ